MDQVMIYLNYEDLSHTLRMVLNDNRGQVMTEALTLGIEHSLIHYLKSIEHKPTPDCEV